MSGSPSAEAPRTAGPNPFVGPRPFERGEHLFGRDREIGELRLRLDAERIVLLHSPSGAGKSSLVQAGFLPRVASSFDVLGPTRVNLDPGAADANRYAFSAIHGFEEGVPESLRRPPEVLAGQTLAEYLERRPRRRSAPSNALVVFDQFEEVLTTDPLGVKTRHAFFDQLGELLRNPRVWALFVLREDYLAPLDPYRRKVPTHLKNRFRIELLDLEAAREAIVGSAREGGRAFPAVDELIQDLATTKVQQADGTFVEEPGQHVEPVQLQVVCRRLWDAMPPEDLSIDAEDLERFGDVTEALGAYYAGSVAAAAEGDPCRERAIRDWFGEELIIPGGIRGQVLREAEASGGLSNELIERLRGTHLIRAEPRAGATWYELAHDRLIEPVQRDNAVWREKYLADVQRRAALWERQGRTAGLLLAGEELAEGECWAAENGARITDVERRFVTESRKAHEIAERERRQARRIHWLVVGVFGALIFAASQWWQTQQALARVYLNEAHRLTEAGEGRQALAYHALFLRRDPTNSAARGWTCALLFCISEPIPLRHDGPVRSDVAQSRLSELLPHKGRVVSASFSPDGLWVVTASDDGIAQVWSAATGQPAAAPIRHGAVLSALFSPDAKRVVTASFDGTARVWNAATGQPVGMPMRHRDFVLSASFSPDGLWVVTASSDGTAQLWNATTGQPVSGPLRHQGPVLSASFSLDGERVVTASEDGTARVWNATTGQPVSKPLRHQGPVLSAAFSLDSERVVTASEDGTARVWNAATGQPVSKSLRHQGPVLSAAFNLDGERVVTGSSDKTAQVWEVATSRTLGKSMRHGGPVRFVSFTPRRGRRFISWYGRRVLTASADGNVRVWEASTGLPMSEPLHHGGAINSASFSRDGMRVLTASDDHTARVWDVLFGTVWDSKKLAELAEAVGGYQVTDRGELKAIPAQERAERLAKLRRMGEQAPANKPTVASFARWYFTPRLERTISPLSKMTVEEYIRALLSLGTEQARREAVEAFPGHPLLAAPQQ